MMTNNLNFTTDKFKHKKLTDKGFTNSQATAIIEFEKFYDDINKLVFTLDGAAGTGKTFTVKYLIDNIIKHSVVVTAPTHKAVRIVERMTNRKGRTLQSLLGLRPDFNLDSFNIDNVQFSTKGEIQLKNYKIVVIDEGSMVNKDIPDYCVVVGSPARIIKRYNPQSGQWEKTDKDGNFIIA